jgi:hypothetical protein
MSIRSAALLLLAAGAVDAATYAYEGHLDDRGQPANGVYDVQLTPFPAEKAGASLAAPIVFERVPVSNGRFRLEFELPPLQSEQAWVEVGVRDPGTSAFSRIPARSKAVATPLIGQCWATTGDTGSNPATNFLGTIDTQPLALRSANQRVTQLEAQALPGPAGGFTASVLQGSPENFIVAGVRGATISGGGARTGDSEPSPLTGEGPNFVSDHYGTVGGGYSNLAGNGGATLNDNPFATVAGGINNQAQGALSTVGGGGTNVAFGSSSTIGGGSGNRANANSTVSGGQNNNADGAFAVIAGGSSNIAAEISDTVGGGFGQVASGGNSSVVGGANNTASGVQSTVGGGSANCAGGEFSWSAGRRAKVRPGTNSGVPGTGCNGVALSGDANGDEGSFAWADATDTNFASTGPNQFLVRASGGLVMQKQIGTETSARAPRGYFNVVQADSGLAQPVAPRADTVASFESNTDAFVRILAPSIEEKGLIFATPESLSDGGIVYLGTDVMHFRTNGNITRMSLGADGTLALQTLGSAGATAVCRNASNQFATCSSSARYKEQIEDLHLGLAAAMQLRPVGYQWRETHAADVGFVAEEVAKLDERLVTRNAKGEVEGVKYDRLTAVLAGAVQELAAREQLQGEAIQRIEAENAAMRSDMAELRALVRSTDARRR